MAKTPTTSKKLCIINVSKSTALISKVCEIRNEENTDIETLLQQIETIRDIDENVYNLALFLVDSSCRISEALEIFPGNIDKLHRVKIIEKKTKSTRIIHTSYSREIVKYMRENSVNVWQNVNRFYVYRIFKMVGISEKFGKNQKSSVTHLIRHASALESIRQGFSETDAKEILGHKNINSTKKYLTPKQTQK